MGGEGGDPEKEKISEAQEPLYFKNLPRLSPREARREATHFIKNNIYIYILFYN